MKTPAGDTRVRRGGENPGCFFTKDIELFSNKARFVFVVACSGNLSRSEADNGWRKG
jgi:hypothetical protein